MLDGQLQLIMRVNSATNQAVAQKTISTYDPQSATIPRTRFRHSTRRIYFQCETTTADQRQRSRKKSAASKTM